MAVPGLFREIPSVHPATTWHGLATICNRPATGFHVGVIITRSWELQQLFKQPGQGDSYGKATTQHEKLWSKIAGGGGRECPILTFAIRPALFVDDGPEATVALKARMAQAKQARSAASQASDENDES